MSIQVLLAFVAACVLLALTPGPNMALIVAKARASIDAARLRLLDGAAGVLLLLGGLALATMRRP